MIFPTWVGMNRSDKRTMCSDINIPHVGGDEPVPAAKTEGGKPYSPIASDIRRGRYLGGICIPLGGAVGKI